MGGYGHNAIGYLTAQGSNNDFFLFPAGVGGRGQRGRDRGTRADVAVRMTTLDGYLRVYCLVSLSNISRLFFVLQVRVGDV